MKKITIKIEYLKNDIENRLSLKREKLSYMN